MNAVIISLRALSLAYMGGRAEEKKPITIGLASSVDASRLSNNNNNNQYF